LSIIAGCSSGIEPLFGLAFTHTILDKKGIVDINRQLLQVARRRGFDSSRFRRQLLDSGTLHGVKGVPDDVRRLFVTSHEVRPAQHVRMQAAFQRHTDNAVSKTVNLPSDATVGDIERVYMLAYDLRCKGISVYRYGSKENQVITFGKKRRCGQCNV
jgi:ribonucleoside-diphosphate reductase alpha chain